jgi:hypothetical protein
MAEVDDEARPGEPAEGWRGRLPIRRGYLLVVAVLTVLAVATGTVWVRLHPVSTATAAPNRTLVLPAAPTTPAPGAEPPLAPLRPNGPAVPAAEPGSTTAGPPRTSPPAAPGPPPLPPAGTGALSVQFTPSTRWDGGMVGYFAIANTTGAPVDGWTLVVTVPGEFTITASWEATMKRDRNTVTFTSTSTSGRIGVGETVRFGIQASTHRGFKGPTSCLINGAPCAG